MVQRITTKHMTWLFGLLLLCNLTYASVTVSPKFLFLNASRKSIPLYVSNPGVDEAEVWLEVKFGYEKSDENGKPIIFMDTTGDNEYSAASWVRVFPRRFILGPGEMQTVRLVAVPPAGVHDGEYWARIFVTSKNRNVSSASLKSRQNVKPGINVMSQTDLPFHFRVGKVTTGVTVNSLDVALNDTAIVLKTKLSRSGNASFWGKRTIKIINSAGITMFTVSKNTGVYTEMTLVDLIKFGGFASGTYSVEIELVSGQRQDVKNSDLLQVPRVLTSATLTIP